MTDLTTKLTTATTKLNDQIAEQEAAKTATAISTGWRAILFDCLDFRTRGA